MFDSWTGVLSENQFRKWVIAPTAEIVRRVKAKYPEIPVIGYPRGSGVLYLDYVKSTGVNGVSLDSTIPLDWAAEVLQPECTLQGNLDNLAVVTGGRVLDQEAKRILTAFSSGPFIFNLGHGLLPDTPPDNVARLVELIRNWNGAGAIPSQRTIP